MKNSAIIAGIALMVFAVAIAAIPQFTSCASQGKFLTTSSGASVPMKCSWTAQAELALGLPAFVVGAMMTASRRREGVRNLSILSVVSGLAIVLVPTRLIGVCSTPGMLCNTVMMPSLVLLGSLTAVAGIIMLYVSIKAREV